MPNEIRSSSRLEDTQVAIGAGPIGLMRRARSQGPFLRERAVKTIEHLTPERVSGYAAGG